MRKIVIVVARLARSFVDSWVADGRVESSSAKHLEKVEGGALLCGDYAGQLKRTPAQASVIFKKS